MASTRTIYYYYYYYYSYTKDSESFQRVKRPGRDVNHPPPFSAEVKERVELYLYSPSGPIWPDQGRNLPSSLPLASRRIDSWCLY